MTSSEDCLSLFSAWAAGRATGSPFWKGALKATFFSDLRYYFNKNEVHKRRSKNVSARIKNISTINQDGAARWNHAIKTYDLNNHTRK